MPKNHAAPRGHIINQVGPISAPKWVRFARLSPQQIARNLTDDCDGLLLGIRDVIMDRHGSFCAAFRDILKSGGVDAVRLPSKSPNLNACVERFHGSLKSECLERLILFGETMLRNAVREFLRHYHSERNHQGLENRILEPGDELGHIADTIHCRERLGGSLPGGSLHGDETANGP